MLFPSERSSSSGSGPFSAATFRCVAPAWVSLFSPLELLLDLCWILSSSSSHYVDFTCIISSLSVLQFDVLRPLALSLQFFSLSIEFLNFNYIFHFQNFYLFSYFPLMFSSCLMGSVHSFRFFNILNISDCFIIISSWRVDSTTGCMC